MALGRIDVKTLAEHIGVELEDLLLSCYYCKRWLTLLDKLLYQHSYLCLYEKENLYYGACQGCLRSAARLEFLLGYQSLVSVQAAEEYFGRSFQELLVRCFCCLRILNTSEKNSTIEKGGDVAIVSDQPRALCTLCSIGLS